MPDRHDVDPPALDPALDIADETYVAVPPGRLAAVVADPRTWRDWWPDLVPVVTRDRGPKGMQWAVTGAVTGTMEVWLEPVAAGTVLHWYLRADPDVPLSARRLGKARERRVRAWKVQMFALKDRLEQFKEGQGSADSR